MQLKILNNDDFLIRIDKYCEIALILELIAFTFEFASIMLNIEQNIAAFKVEQAPTYHVTH